MRTWLLLILLCFYSARAFELDLAFLKVDTDSETKNCEPFNHHDNSNRCNYVKSEECDEVQDGGHFDYLAYYFCSGVPPIVNDIIFIYLLINVFVVLGEVADVYFAPTMTEVSDTLGVSETVSGVTFMALGNGAPDISASIDALTGTQPELGLSALLGAAVFVPVVVSAAVALSTPGAKIARRPYMRDIVFLFCSVAYILYIAEDKKITKAEAFSLWAIYACYVGSVLVGECYRMRKKDKEENDTENPERDNKKSFMDAFALLSTESQYEIPDPNANKAELKDAKKLNFSDVRSESSFQSDSGSEFSAANNLTHHLLINHDGEEDFETADTSRTSNSESQANVFEAVPRDPIGGYGPLEETDDDETISSWTKLYYVLTFPAQLVMWVCWLTCPDMEPENWNGKTALMLTITSPLWTWFAFDLWKINIHLGNTSISTIWIILLVSLIPFSIVACRLFAAGVTWRPDKAGKIFFLLLGFVSSVSWIYIIANELVNLLSVLGILLNISQSVLGLTVLAWGNSLGDLVADVAVAKAGKPAMAISACFGGPLLNILIGTGVSMTINTMKGKENFPLATTIVVSAIGVLMGCIVHCLTVPTRGWTLTKSMGYICIAYYMVWCVICVLGGLNVY